MCAQCMTMSARKESHPWDVALNSKYPQVDIEHSLYSNASVLVYQYLLILCNF